MSIMLLGKIGGKLLIAPERKKVSFCLVPSRKNSQLWMCLVVKSQIWRSSIQSAKSRPGTDCGSNHELLIAKFRFKLKKVGKSTRPFRYKLNQIPYDYTLEVTNRFKGLDLIDRVPEELWMEVHNIVQETKTISKKINAKRKNGCLRRPYRWLRKDENRKAKEKGKDI